MGQSAIGGQRRRAAEWFSRLERAIEDKRCSCQRVEESSNIKLDWKSDSRQAAIQTQYDENPKGWN